MKINNSIEKPRWYSIKCNCNHDSVETEYPIMDCLHCKFEEAEKSLPKENFETKNEDGSTRIVQEVTIVRGSKYQEIIGWTF